MKPKEFVLSLVVPVLVGAWLALCWTYRDQITGFVVQHTTDWADPQLTDEPGQFEFR